MITNLCYNGFVNMVIWLYIWYFFEGNFHGYQSSESQPVIKSTCDKEIPLPQISEIRGFGKGKTIIYLKYLNYIKYNYDSL